VLLVEDDEGDALIVRELLEDAVPPFDVRWRRTVAEAKPELGNGIDCVLLDLGLPDASGLEALEAIRAADADTAILVLTGLQDADRGAEAVARGAQDYLVKGQVDSELLARSLRYAIGRSRAETAQRNLRAVAQLADENARLERGLLPRPLLFDERLSVVAGYRPGRRPAQLGGDFYDVVETRDGTVHAMVGDVCGHGPDEAALGVCLRIAWRTLVLGGRSDDAILATMEEVLIAERHSEDLFATLCMVSIAPDHSHASLRLAGHPPPILLRGTQAPRSLPRLGGRPPLGVQPQASWPASAVDLPRAPWSLVLYTDGLIEAADGTASGRLGIEGLEALLGDAVGSPAIDDLIEHVEGLGDGTLADDVAVLVLTAGAPPA
jgi:serine phosphatase RsbU (regulator of sigma subunit)